MTFEATSSDKILPRGNSRRYRLTIREPKTGSNPNPAAIDLTGALIRFTMKLAPDQKRLQPTDVPVVTKTSDDITEIEVMNQTQAATKGQCVIKLVPADTRFLPPGTYVYSVEVRTAAGDEYDVAEGKIFLRASATESEDLTPP